MNHQLKILPSYFQLVWDGKKPFELRKDDRGYGIGDVLILNEWSNGKYTGRAIRAKVTCVLRDCEEYGLQDGFCIMGIKIVAKVEDGDNDANH